MSGGGITPTGRVEVAVGGAARVPLGKLGRPEEPADSQAQAPIELTGLTARGGLSPLALLSLPLGNHFDIGLQLAGSALGVNLRRGFELGENTALIGALAPYAGWLLLSDSQGGQSSSGLRLGANSPWVVAVNMGGVYEAWAGARAGFEHGQCEFELQGTPIGVSGEVFRLGALLGLGVGFRHFAALMELTADREWWQNRGEIEPGERSGFSLTPAFALRLRL